MAMLVAVLLLVGGTVADPFPQKCRWRGDMVACPRNVFIASYSDTIEARRLTFERLTFFNLTRDQAPNVTFIGVSKTNLNCSMFEGFPTVFLNSIPCEFNLTTTDFTPTVTRGTRKVTQTTVKSTSTVVTRRTFKTRKPFPNPKTWRPTTTTTSSTTTATTDPDYLTYDTRPDIRSSPVPRELFTTTRTFSTTNSPLKSRVKVLTIIIAVLVTVVVVLLMVVGILVILRHGCGKVCRKRRKPAKAKPIPAETLYGNAFSIDDEEENTTYMELKESPRRRHRKEKKN